jgi:cytochrome c biogenesis protein CcmG, thiol:disulfide interchange protein DsbE
VTRAAVSPPCRGPTRRRLLAAALALSAAACGGKDSRGRIEPGRAAPPLSGKTLAGEYVALEDFRGQVVLVNVWATWCGPCREELPELARLAREHRDAGLVVLGISVDAPGARRQVLRLVAEAGVDYPIVLDPHGRQLGSYQIQGYPTTFVIGRDGTLRWRRDGMIRNDDEPLAAVLRDTLAEPTES